MIDTLPILAVRMRQARQKRNYTIQELATKADTSYQTVSRIERGKLNPSADLLLRLADALHESLDWLCGRYASR